MVPSSPYAAAKGVYIILCCKDVFGFVVLLCLYLYFIIIIFALGQERCDDSIYTAQKGDMGMVTVLLDRVGIGCCETKLKQAQ